MFILQKGDLVAVVAIYVDDKVLVGHPELVNYVRSALSGRFPMKDLGPARSLLGVQIICDRMNRTLSLKQGGFIRKILSCYGMQDCSASPTPMEVNLDLPKLPSTPPEALKFPYQSAIGKLLYLALGTRPDIAFVVTYLSRFVTGYDQRHWKALLRVLHYRKGTPDYGVTYGPSAEDPLILHGAGDSDWGGDTIERKSVTGYFFFLGGGPISWKTRKQSTVALSSTEAEYLSATDSAKQAIYHRNFLNEIGLPQPSPTIIKADNQGAIAISQNPCKHERTKHFDIRHHFIREKVMKGVLKLEYLPTTEMVADILTKALPRVKFEQFRDDACVFHISDSKG